MGGPDPGAPPAQAGPGPGMTTVSEAPADQADSDKSADSALARSCNDFGSWAEAQAFFVASGGPTRDPFGLDADGDGVACEALLLRGR